MAHPTAQDAGRKAEDRVEHRPIRVLLVEQEPRWEYRYVKNALLRAAPDVQTQVWLIHADAAFVQEHSQGVPALRALPRTRDELARYDVILLGDVDPARLQAGDRQRDAWLRELARRVADGGGLAFLAGARAMPERYRGSPIEAVLPVELATPSAPAKPTEPAKPHTPRKTANAEGSGHWIAARTAARPVVDKQPPGLHPLLRLVPDPARAAEVWNEFGGFFSYYRAARERDDAESLLSHSRDKNRHGRVPLLVLSAHQRGRTCFVATDETWRLRSADGEPYYEAFWRNVVRWLAGRVRPGK